MPKPDVYVTISTSVARQSSTASSVLLMALRHKRLLMLRIMGAG